MITNHCRSLGKNYQKVRERIGCSKSVRPSTAIYIIYITQTNFEHHFSQLFLVKLFYRGGPFIKNVPFVETRKMSYIFKIGEQSL